MRVKAVSIAVVLSLLLSVIAMAAPLWQVVRASATEVYYDDGAPAGFVQTACPPCSNFQGVKFSLPSQMLPASTLTGVRFYCNSGSQGATLKVHITAGDPTVELVAPITYLPSGAGWHTVSVPGIDITGDFWVIVERGSNAHNIDMAYDASNDSGRSYYSESLSHMMNYPTPGDLLIRAVLGGDSTPPTTPVVVDDGDYTNDNTQLHGSWSSSDNESGIAEYQYAIGVTQGGTDVVGWTSVGTATAITKSGLTLSWGTTYYFAVKAKNGAGLWSDVGTSNGITAQAPPPPTITSISPNQGIQGQALSSVTLTGTYFTRAASLIFGSGITVNSFDVDNETQITASISINSAATMGARDISLTTPAGTATSTGAFFVATVTTHDIGTQGGTVGTTDGRITTALSENAVTGNTAVTIKQISAASVAATPKGFKVGNTCFTVEAVDDNGNAIVTFSQPVTITVKYSEEDVAAAGGDPTKLALAYYDEAAAEWKTLDTTVNTTDKTLSATTNHFSTWAVLAKSPSEGLTSWIWIVVGIAAALGAGIVAYFLRRRLLQKA